MSPTGIGLNCGNGPRDADSGSGAVLSPTDRWTKKTHVMYCQRCADLLAAYRGSVNLHTTALRKSLGAPGCDEEVERLSLKCRETNEVLMAHWRKEHRSVAAKSGS